MGASLEALLTSSPLQHKQPFLLHDVLFTKPLFAIVQHMHQLIEHLGGAARMIPPAVSHSN